MPLVFNVGMVLFAILLSADIGWRFAGKVVEINTRRRPKCRCEWLETMHFDLYQPGRKEFSYLGFCILAAFLYFFAELHFMDKLGVNLPFSLSVTAAIGAGIAALARDAWRRRQNPKPYTSICSTCEQ